jgi:4-hydroxybenzoate polyprenyltransferase
LPPAVRALRPLQWTKNGVLFAALVFDQRLFELGPLLRTVVAAIIFCGLSSAVYLINDVRDIEADRQHPVKRLRAVASGELRPQTALTIAAVLLPVSLGIAYLVQPEFFLISLVYVGLMIAYTFWLKRVVLVDVLTIAAGFVLRAAAGAVAISVEISPWLLVCTMLLALLLGFGKRRNEVLTLRSRAARHRASLETYSARLLDQLIGITAASTVIAYAVYTFDSASVPANHTMMLTIPLVVYAIFRYLYLVYLRRLGGSPELMLVRDRPLLVSIVLWGLGSVLVLYLWA